MTIRENRLRWAMALLFLVCGVIGGGRTSPLLTMTVELIACALLMMAAAGAIDGQHPRSANPSLIFILAVLCVPLFQLVPLPADLWSNLPGHGIPSNILRAAGLDHTMRPLSLDPEQTKLAILTLIVPIAVFIAGLQIGPVIRDQMILLVVAFAFVSAVLGVFQVSAGGGLDLHIYALVHDGYAIGFFANRNHEATLQLIALPFSAHIIRIQPWRRRNKQFMIAGDQIFFSLAVISTISRAGLTLLPLAILGSFIVWIGDVRDRRIKFGIVAVILLMIFGYFILNFTPLGSMVLRRFTQIGEDLRPHIWQASVLAIKDFWPWGSGVGSFVPTFAMFEDLDTMRFEWVNHAHNDYLELLLVAGLPAAILIVGYFILALLALKRRAPSSQRSQRYAAVTALLIVLIHSLVDYPLRTSLLLAIFAFSNALLFQPREAKRVNRAGSYPVNPQPAFASKTQL